MDKSKLIRSVIIVFLLLLIKTTLVGQNISYSVNNTSDIDVGEKVVLQNTSTGMPAGVTYKWEFESCSFEINTVLYCDYSTDNIENSIEGSFVQYGNFFISLTAYDDENKIIGSSYSRTFALNITLGECNNSTCQDIEPFSCFNPNLICNYSFEKIDLPYDPSNTRVYDQDQVRFAQPWCNIGSSDLFLRGMVPNGYPPTNGLDVGIPSNEMGNRETHTGDAYAGLFTMSYNENIGSPYNHVEYIQTPIKNAIVNGVSTSALFAGQRYGLSFYFANAGKQKFATDGLQAYFSANKLATGGVGTAQQTIVKSDTDPNLLHPFDGTITDSKDWVQFYSEYIPTTNNIKHLTIGYFRYLTADDIDIHYKLVNSASVQNAYYFIDDVTLIPLPPVVSVNSPNNCDGVELTVMGKGAGSYYWSTGETTASISVNPQSTTTYTVTVTDFYGCNPVVLNSVVSVDPLEKAEISGDINNCSDIAIYSVDNPMNDYIYTWSTQVFNSATNQYTTGNFIINSNGNVDMGTSASIDWTSFAFPSLPGYVLISCEAYNEETGCSSITNYKVYQCCDGDIDDINEVLRWSNETISTDIYTTKRIVVNGEVHISSDVYINAQNMFMGPMAKIIVDDEASLTIHSTAISESDCNYMWDGIYASTNKASITITESSLTRAVNGVVSEKGGELIINDVTFTQNKTCLQILNNKNDAYSNPPQSYKAGTCKINNCTFGAQYGYSNLITPYANLQEETGVKISDVEGVTIGDITGGGNEFNHLITGINIYNSKVNIYNNTFTNINTNNYPITNNEAAISINSRGVYDMANICDVVVGGFVNGIAIPGTNTFNNCINGIYSNNSRIIVDENIFKYGDQAVRIFNFRSGTAVQNNRFKDVNSGVRVNNLLGMNRQLLVKDNYFEGIADDSYTNIMTNAINIINCNSAPNSNEQTKIANNTITFSGLRTYYTDGIIVQNCEGIMVNSNHITRLTSINNMISDYSTTRGIKIASCHGAQIVDNYIYGFGNSIYTFGNLQLTQFYCNDLRAYRYGFAWGLGSFISTQGRQSMFGYSGLNTHNQWHNASALNAENLMINNPSLAQTNINWYYFDNIGSQWIPNTSYASLGTITPVASNNAVTSHLCIGDGLGSSGTGGGNSNNGGSSVDNLFDNIVDPELRDYMLEGLMEGEEYLKFQNEYRAYDADYLYKLLSADQSMMWLGGTNDADYQEFFDKVKDENIGKFAEVYNYIEDGEYENAIELNNSITPEQFIFANLQTVLRIYLNSWCKNRYELSEGEYNSLYTIANLTPYAGGDAVCTARIMIGFDPDEHELAYRMREEETKQNKESLVLYPNPASNKVTIEFTNDTYENLDAILEVYTITGKLIYQTNFNTNKSFKELSVEMLKNGVYIYKISLSNGMDKSGKLVILKN